MVQNYSGMPYSSEAQRKYFNANREKLEAEGVDVDEWNETTKGKKLPKKVKEKELPKKANDTSFLSKEVRYNGPNINTPTPGAKTLRGEVNRWYDNAGGFNNAVDKAQVAQRNRNTSVLGNSKWPKWSPQQLDNKVNVTKGPNWRENFGVYGFYSPSIGSLRSPSIHLSNNSNQAALEHEMSHSVFNPGISNTIKGMAFGANDAHSNKSPNTGLLDSGHKRYISDPGEVDVRLAEIKRRYAKSTGKLVTNPQEAQEAWNWWKQNSNSYPSATNSQNSSDNNSPTMHSSEFEYYDNAPENIKKQYFHRMPELVSNRSNNLNKVSSEDISTSFLPDYTPDQLKEMGVYKEVYGAKDAPRLASLPEWPAHWYNEADPHGWLQWYDRHSKGRRIEDDKRQIKRWISFKARHGGKAFRENPTPRRAFALRNWGIDPAKLVDDPEALKAVMDEYKQKQYSKKMEKISFLPKEARKIDPTDYDAHEAYLMSGKKMPGSAMPSKDYFSKNNLIESLPWDTEGGLGAALKERGFQNLRDTMDGNIIMTDKDGNLYTWDHELGGIARGHYNLITDRDMDWHEEYKDSESFTDASAENKDINKVSFLSFGKKEKEGPTIEDLYPFNPSSKVEGGGGIKYIEYTKPFTDNTFNIIKKRKARVHPETAETMIFTHIEQPLAAKLISPEEAQRRLNLIRYGSENVNNNWQQIEEDYYDDQRLPPLFIVANNLKDKRVYPPYYEMVKIDDPGNFLEQIEKMTPKIASFLPKSAKDEKPGLWANIRAKRRRGEPPAKPGDKAYPDKEQWSELTKKEAGRCWDGYEPVPGKKPYAPDSCRKKSKKKDKSKKADLSFLPKVAKSPAWQRSEGKNSEGGLNAKGRASYNRENGGNLKAPVTEKNPSGKREKRQNSFCSRMCGMKKSRTSDKTKNDPDSRINKALRKWRCRCG